MSTGIYQHKPNQGFQKGNKLYEHPNCQKVQFKKGQKSKNWNGFKKGQLPTSGSFKKGHTLTQERHDRGEFKFLIGNTNTKGKHWKIEDTSKYAGGKNVEGKHWKVKDTSKMGCQGENHWNWQGGKSFEIYSQDWTEDLKDSIRKRDNYICQMEGCGIHQDELDKKLDVHHIDYNKKNCDPKNLVTLCRKCHIKTNFNREEWVKYFKYL